MKRKYQFGEHWSRDRAMCTNHLDFGNTQRSVDDKGRRRVQLVDFICLRHLMSELSAHPRRIFKQHSNAMLRRQRLLGALPTSK
jgi:hypothetical protein